LTIARLLRLLLLFVPASLYLGFTHARPATRVRGPPASPWCPWAGLMGEATETIARRTGAGLGGLLNATFVTPRS